MAPGTSCSYYYYYYYYSQHAVFASPLSAFSWYCGASCDRERAETETFHLGKAVYPWQAEMWRIYIPLWCQNSPPMTWENGYSTWTKSQNRHERKKISYENPAPTASSAGLELVADPHELIENMVENPGFWPDFPLKRLMECGFNMTVSHAGLTGLPICRWQKKTDTQTWVGSL